MNNVALGAAGAKDRGPVGAILTGKVTVLSDVGIGYVLEEHTGRRFVVARALDERRFDLLRVGQPISFRVNEYNALAQYVD